MRLVLSISGGGTVRRAKRKHSANLTRRIADPWPQHGAPRPVRHGNRHCWTSGGTGGVLPAERARCSFNPQALEEAMGSKARRG